MSLDAITDSNKEAYRSSRLARARVVVAKCCRHGVLEWFFTRHGVSMCEARGGNCAKVGDA